MVICANKILKAVITLLIIWVWGASIIKVQSLYNCGECEETSQHVVRADNLVDHMRSKHDQSSYNCGECGETFDNNRTLSEHVGRTHKDEGKLWRAVEHRMTRTIKMAVIMQMINEIIIN